MPLFYNDCNRQTKSKLEDENKTNKLLCIFSNFVWWKIKNKETESIFIMVVQFKWPSSSGFNKCLCIHT